MSHELHPVEIAPDPSHYPRTAPPPFLVFDPLLGGIALRHESNDFVRWAGHIGYGIRPSARRRGLAIWALGRMLDEARVLGMDRVLVVCEADNVASARTIERHGGVLDDIQDTEHGPARRYWIKIGDPSV